jgi:glutamate racemase
MNPGRDMTGTKIGVFDSGLGGLIILNAIREELPHYDYVYLGDTANLPYGDKTEDEIVALTKAAVERLFNEGVLLAIVACNTASVEAVRTLQETMLKGTYEHHRILGIVIPTVEELMSGTSRNVLLIGTTRTIASEKYEIELQKISGHSVALTSVATPELVPYIESGNLERALDHLERLLNARVGEIDTLVLGCSHYTVLKDELRMRYPNLRLLSQDEIIPAKLKTYLQNHPEIETRLTQESTCEHIITGTNPGSLSSAGE